MTTQEQSLFEEEEGAIKNLPFGKFFSTNEPVVFKTQNRFEGKSNYNSYYPTSDILEQNIEKYWFESQNRKVAEKRREEELHGQVREWSSAKERLSVEISRKIENQNQGTRFEKARGYVRSNYSTKNFDHNHNPLLEDTLSSEDEEAQIQQKGGNMQHSSSRGSFMTNSR